MSKYKFNESKIKPLGGIPMISANCWQAILDAFDQRSNSEKSIRCLEWGGGNSTISFVKRGINIEIPFELISIDHQTTFFPWLAESVIGIFLNNSDKNNLKVSWQKLNGPSIKLSDLGDVLKLRKKLKSSFLTWQIILNNKRIQYTDRFKPNYSFRPLIISKQMIKLFLSELGYWRWILRGLSNGIINGPNFKRMHYLGNPLFEKKGDQVVKDSFSDYFKGNPDPGCLKINFGDKYVELWHVPSIKSPILSNKLLLDGPVTQLSDYVNVLVDGNFDIVFIDGRARVSCIKRTFYNNLLKKGGWLFVHDAFRSEMMEGFLLFSSTPSFISGSNKTLSGDKRCDDKDGPPLVKIGHSLENFNQEIAQELFIYKNEAESI